MESRHLRLTVFRHHRDSVIDVDFSGANGHFSLDALLIAASVANPGMACRDESLLRDRLNWLSDFLDAHYGNLLKGDETTFVRLSAVARERDREYNRKLLTAPIITEANKAFSAQDYAEVERLLSPIWSQLDPTSAKKLRLARRLRTLRSADIT